MQRSLLLLVAALAVFSSTAAAQDVLSSIGSTVAGAVDTVTSTVGTVVADAKAAVSSATGSAKHEWDSIFDLVSTKNNTVAIGSVIDDLVNSGAPGVDELAKLLNSTTELATVFLPRDEDITAADEEELKTLLDSDPATLIKVLSYHVVPGQALTLEQLTDGLQLQTLVPGPEGIITVAKAAGAQKPNLITSSGQKVAVYQYKLKGGEAEAFTIKGILRPGAAAAAPSPAQA